VHEQHSPEYRTVAVFGSLADAELVRGMLEADGIAAAVLDGTDAALLPGAGRAVRVLVPTRDIARAREILADPGDGFTAGEADEDVSFVATAPQCARSWALGWIALLLVIALLAAAFAL
jgi:Putative prokaryotic signal transducing protein